VDIVVKTTISRTTTIRIKITCAAKKSEGGVNSGGGSSWVEGVTEFQHVWFFWFVGIAKTNLSPDILTQPREKAISFLRKNNANVFKKSNRKTKRKNQQQHRWTWYLIFQNNYFFIFSVIMILVMIVILIIIIIIIITIPLFTLGSICSNNASRAEQMPETNNSNQT